MALYDAYGDVGAVRLDHQPRPEPGPGQVLVDVVAAGVSHMDLYVRQGRFADTLPVTFPARQGTSFAGFVRTVGPGVQGVRHGAAVLGHDPAHGAHADAVVVEAGAVVLKPERVTWEVGGALYLVGLTAYRLIQRLRLSEQDVVVVSAAAGGVGHLECQLAHLAGARVVGIAGEENHDYLRSIGVRPVAYGPGLAERIRRSADGERISAFLDNYGSYESLGAELSLPMGRFVASERRREVEVELYRAPGDDRIAAIELRDVAQLVADWNIRVLVSGFYGLDDLALAMADLDARHSRGVVVVGTRTSAAATTYRSGKLRDRFRVEH